MNDGTGKRPAARPHHPGGHPGSGHPGGGEAGRGGDTEALSGVAILAILAAIAAACIGGYFLLMKLVDISRQEDCMLGGGRHCIAPLQVLPDRQ